MLRKNMTWKLQQLKNITTFMSTNTITKISIDILVHLGFILVTSMSFAYNNLLHHKPSLCFEKELPKLVHCGGTRRL
jgi:hypothetical protein